MHVHRTGASVMLPGHPPPPRLGCLQVTSYEKALAALKTQVEQGLRRSRESPELPLALNNHVWLVALHDNNHVTPGAAACPAHAACCMPIRSDLSSPHTLQELPSTPLWQRRRCLFGRRCGPQRQGRPVLFASEKQADRRNAPHLAADALD